MDEIEVSPKSVEERLESLELEVSTMRVMIEEIYKHVLKADKTLSIIGEKVEPFLEELSNSPMLKMLGGFGKGKKRD